MARLVAQFSDPYERSVLIIMYYWCEQQEYVFPQFPIKHIKCEREVESERNIPQVCQFDDFNLPVCWIIRLDSYSS